MNRPTIHTVLSPALLDLYDLAASIFVVIDVFRATSTIATALHNGASKVIPVSSVEECIALGKLETNAITAGERDGKVIPGLQYGNSPTEYPSAFINSKTLVLTTTNGTKLLHMAHKNRAEAIITGSFSNLSAVTDFLLEQNKPVILGCSGWKNLINLEDTLFAGAVVSRLKKTFDIPDDSSNMAQMLYENNQHDLISFAKTATHWHRLANYGLSADLEYCVTPDIANSLCIFRDGALRKY